MTAIVAAEFTNETMVEIVTETGIGIVAALAETADTQRPIRSM
jgi:hypothetical protein